jgi:hypothetical protein
MDEVGLRSKFQYHPDSQEILANVMKNARTHTCPVTRRVMYEVPDCKIKQTEEESHEHRHEVNVDHGNRSRAPPATTGDQLAGDKPGKGKGKGKGKDKDTDKDDEPPAKRVKQEVLEGRVNKVLQALAGVGLELENLQRRASKPSLRPHLPQFVVHSAAKVLEVIQNLLEEATRILNGGSQDKAAAFVAENTDGYIKQLGKEAKAAGNRLKQQLALAEKWAADSASQRDD